MPNRYIVLAAQVISTIFTPFYLPTVAFVVLMQLSYLNKLPLPYKSSLTVMVFVLTVILPRTVIYLYRKVNGWKRHEMGTRERRYVPYIISISCYTILLYIMEHLHMPHFMSSVVAASLLIQIVCALVNHWIRVSLHAAASGGVVGMLFAFSLIFHFNALWWLVVCVILCGCVCSARMLLRQHNYQELFFGVLIGIISGWACVLFL